MPHAIQTTVSSPIDSLVIVTGANGFIASHTIHNLLLKGHRVLGTVRSEDKATVVRKTHARLTPASAHLLDVAVVPDITALDAYTSLFAKTEPVAVLHMAAPFAYTTTNFEQDLLLPAVRGTESVFHAVAQTPSIRRVVHTNSFACIYDASLGPRPGYTYTASDWCPLKYEDGVNAGSPQVAYRASKAVAERRGWEFVEKRSQDGSGCGFDLVSLCPAMVFGPYLPTPHSMPSSSEELNTSNKLVWDVVSAGQESAVPPTRGPVWIDVRDVAEAHVKALDLDIADRNGEVGGKVRRLLLAKGVYCSQEIADLAREVAEADKQMEKYLGRIPVGSPGQRDAATHFGVDASSEEGELGGKSGWRGLRETLLDLVPQLYAIEGATAETNGHVGEIE